MKAGHFSSVIIVLLAGCALVARADTPTFDRYQIILSRKPFGAPPPPPATPAAPVVEEKKFTEGFRLSMIVESEDGEISVGFADAQNKSYMMKVGETRESIGITLVSADYNAGEIVLQKGDRTETLRRGDKGGSSTPSTSVNTPAKRPSEAGSASYAQRRRARAEQLQREQQEALKPPEPQYTGQELEKHLHDYQMEVIRQGLPPLPIPLTQEQDDQLVAEGYLPPTP